MSTFRPLATRGAFVPSGLPGRTTAFTTLATAPTTGFSAGLSIRLAAPVPEAVTEPVVATASAAEPEAVTAAEPAAEPAPVAAPEPAPRSTAPVSAMDRLRGAELTAAIATAERTAAEFAEREALREAEHKQLLADLDSQKQKTRATNERLGQLAAELQRARDAMMSELRGGAGELLLQGARRLAGEALRTQPGLLEGLVDEIVASLAGEVIVVRANPDDVERLTIAVGERVRVHADPAVSAGCIVSGDGGAVDASLDTATRALRGEVDAWKRTG